MKKSTPQGVLFFSVLHRRALPFAVSRRYEKGNRLWSGRFFFHTATAADHRIAAVYPSRGRRKRDRSEREKSSPRSRSSRRSRRTVLGINGVEWCTAALFAFHQRGEGRLDAKRGVSLEHFSAQDRKRRHKPATRPLRARRTRSGKFPPTCKACHRSHRKPLRGHKDQECVPSAALWRTQRKRCF